MNYGAKYNYSGIPIHAVAAQRYAYDSYPSCQRDYVWKKGMQQKLIDSILRGLPIPPITIMPVSENSILGTQYWVVDGQQRLKTILKYLNGEFKTAKGFSLEPGIRPIEGGRFYNELSPAAKNNFDYYLLQICLVSNIDSTQTGLVYRRLNYQVKLKFAEVLYSYDSKTKDLADSLYNHSFWDVIYEGKKDRKQVFMMSVHIIFMEVMDIYANMTSPRLAEIVFGKKDDLIEENLRKKITSRLLGLERVFLGATIRAYTEIIPIYQAGMLLEADGYNLSKSKEGCLARWYMGVRQSAVELRRKGVSDPLGILNNVNRQRSFWEEHLPNIYRINGLFKTDNQREFNELDKIIAWKRQNGRCPYCDKLVRISDVGHHKIPHSEGGKTTSDNCILAHADCHKRAHQLRLD